MYMSLSKFQELVLEREACYAAVHGFTELDTTEWLNCLSSVKNSIGNLTEIALNL